MAEIEVVAQRRIINRNYVCRLCGKMRRAPADYVPGASPAPECCEQPMQSLSYEATVVANRMSEVERVEWLGSGGRVGQGGWPPPLEASRAS